MKKIKIVIPIYNDWEGFIKIVSKIESLHQETELDIEIIAVNDCSTISLNEAINSKLLKITLINLAKNSGNQKAISIGLNYINEKYNDKEFDYVIIMDSDGEDKPEDISKLVEECAKRKKIIFAKRNKRNETFFFKFLYFIYKISFKILTKEQIDFGNFSRPFVAEK